MQRFFLFILIIVSSFTTITAQEFTFSAKKYHQKVESSLNTKFKEYQIFQLNTDDLENHARQTDGNTEISLRFGEEYNWNLDLLNSHLFADNYLLRDGKTTINSQRPIPMQGYLSGGNNERVALTVSENFIYGYIQEAGKTYYIEPLRYFTSNQEENLFVIYEESNVITDNTIKCAVTEKHQRGQHLDSQHKTETTTEEKSMLACKLLELAIASDFLMFQSYGSVAAVEAHNVGVMNTVATDYDDSFNDEIQFVIVEQFVPSSAGADPISDDLDIEVILDEFTAWGPGGFTNTHDLGQHWSARDYNTTTIGLAWIGVVCENFRYHVLEDFQSTEWALRVLTSHEMGHNFNQDHDDSGSNFIMAPSVNNTAIWSAASIAGFNSYIPTLNCLSACPPDMPPAAAFSTQYTQLCTGGLTRFENTSTGQVQSVNWSFPGGTPASSTEQNPLIQYNNPGTYAVSLTATNNAGGNTTTQSGYITVGSGGTDFFFYEDFEAGLGGFTVENPDNSTTWTPITVVAAPYSTQAMYMDNYNYNDIGRRDYLISPTVDFSGRTDAVLEIDYAYTYYDQINNDSLIVSISTDNGTNWLRVFVMGEDGTGSLATRPPTFAPFAPEDESDWCFAGTFGSACLQVDLSEYSSASTKIRLENYNGFGNNMYIETISMTSSCQSFIAPTALFSVVDNQGCEPFTTQYFDNSDGSPTSWNWSFPGGIPASSTQQNPTVTYNTPGTYDASLVVTNDVGSDSQTQNSVINVNASTISNFNFVVNGMTVDFTDASQNATSYIWSFGDTETSGQINPSHTYANEGIYPVTLTVTNACGSNDFTQNVTIEGMPNAVFSANNTNGCTPLSVDFSNFSSGLNSTSFWDFPGGTPATSTEENPTVIYNTSGVYSVTLTVTNSAGSDTQIQNNLIVINNAPVGGFTSVANELSVDFTTNTTPLPTDVSWNFGDTNTSTELNPTHTYDMEGTYTVTFTASNECGTTTDMSTVEVSLTPTAPIAGFTANSVTGCEPFTVDFINQSSDNSETYNWTFEGGTPATSTDTNPTVTYSTAGNYSVSLMATNEVGESTFEETNLITVNPLPSANFTAATNELAVEFTNTSTEATSYSWEFGDANVSTEINPSHTYNAEGTYTVTLVSTNNCGSITETMDVIIALTPVAPTAAFIANVNEGCEPFTVEFSSQSSDNTEDLLWTFASGTPATSTDANPTVTYNTSGTFDVSLVASNEVGNNEVMQTNFIVVNPLPSADFTPVANELSVNFGDNSQNVDTYAWNFGDTNISAETNPSHTYDSEGTYTVSLTVTNDCGTDVFTEIIEVSLTPVAPTAAFIANVNEGCEPFTVEFSSQSSDNTEDLLWTFAGGTPATSTDANPTVTYNTSGTFDVSLVASNEVGNNEVMQTNFIVVNPLPSADFTPVANELEVTFNNNSQNGDTYTWDFGDTNISGSENPIHTYDTEGIYLVNLIVTNDCGTTNFIQEVTVSLVPVAPTAAFTATETTGCAPFTVQYTSQSSANVASLLWQFEGGIPATSTEANPIVIYTTIGSFNTSLTAINEAGNDMATETNYISINDVPMIDFSEVINVLEVDFLNTTTNADTYAWNFGDTNISALENPTHTYDEAGTYNVSLTATNECGSTEVTTEVTVSLLPTAPTAAFSSDISEGCTPLTVTLTNLSSANATSYLWEIDGPNPATSTEVNPVFIFTTAGAYSITLTATNEVGTDTQTQTDFVVVNDAPFVTGFTSSVFVNAVTFFENSEFGDSYHWNFGDNTESIEQNPSHEYAEAGSYLVILTVTNECGETVAVNEVTVGSMMPMTNFFADIEEDCVPFVVQFMDNSSNDPTSWNWTFAGGTPATSTEQNPVVTFNTQGEYDVILSAANEVGSNSLFRNKYINALGDPIASFAWTNAGLDIFFSNTSFDGTSYAWDFGDGFSTTSVSPAHTYELEGIYTVTLTVENDCGTAVFSDEIDLRNTGIGELDFLSDFNLYPNPNNGQFTLVLTGEGLYDDLLEICLINIVGQTMSYEQVNFTGNLERTYNHNNLAAGMYFIELRAGNKNVYKKVVIE